MLLRPKTELTFPTLRRARVALIAAGVALFAAALPAQKEAPAAPTDEQALATGVRVLLANQEQYKPDRLRRRVDDEQLEAWQKEQLENLESLRKAKAVEWPYEGVYTVQGSIPPGYRVGGTAIVCEALVLTDGYGESKPRQLAVKRAIDFMIEELEKNPRLEAGPKTGYDVRGWAHTYALDFFLLALERGVLDEKTTARARKLIPHLIECIAANECREGGGRRGGRRRRGGQQGEPQTPAEPGKKTGGWNYAGGSGSPFMTGSTLIALFRARAAGFDVDRDMVDRALGALEASRVESGSYAYSGPASRGGGRRLAMPGACARAAIAELCLFRAGRSDQKKLRVATEAFFEHWGELEKRKSKQGTHEGDYGIAPYYFFYGHTYAALAIEHLPESDRPALRKRLRETLWRTRESDGSWNDRVFVRTQSYSTAMCMLALLAPKVEIPEWSAN